MKLLNSEVDNLIKCAMCQPFLYENEKDVQKQFSLRCINIKSRDGWVIRMNGGDGDVMCMNSDKKVLIWGLFASEELKDRVMKHFKKYIANKFEFGD